jgi:phosphoribosylformylglycinamidine synthase II
MAHQIHVQYIRDDGRAFRVLKNLQAHGKIGQLLTNVMIVDVYTIDAKLTRVELTRAADALYNPLSQCCSINQELSPKEMFSLAFEVGFAPGVTDNIGHTAKETIEDVLKRPFVDGENVYTSRLYFVGGQLQEGDATTIAAHLHNPLIQYVRTKSFIGYRKDAGMEIILPKVVLTPGTVTEVDLDIDDDALIVLGKKGIKNADDTYRGPLGFGLPELKAIRVYFTKKRRRPTDIELEALAQTWSEHCKHTIFANPLDEIKDGIYKHYIKRATKVVRKKKGEDDFCVSVFSDNSGVIKFDKDTYITHKVETHNSPSVLDPFGGAITGILGVNRDCIGTGMGAKPLLNMYGYCFADPADKTRVFRDTEKTQELLSAKRIMDGVIEGVNAGGNQSGIPTPQGFTYFEERFRGKPLVFVGTVGVMPSKVNGKPSFEKKAEPGDYIVMLGGRVGLDGIHGATFSSEALDGGSPATAVQIGDAITQKKFSDAIVKEARDQGLYSSITDNGAGGLSSSVGEMAEQSDGCEVYLDAVPVKYPGLSPWQIWISESQERMTLAVPKSKWKALRALMESRGVEATIIGEFNNSGVCTILHDGVTVLEIDMEFMHDGNPVHAQKSVRSIPELSNPSEAVTKKFERNISKTMLGILKRGNIGSTEFISSQYDHEVQGVSVTKPLHGKGRVNASASVSRPHTDTKKGIVLSQGICPRYSDLDTYHMAASAIDQAMRGIVAIGGDPTYVALLDNFCWCSSSEPKRLYELKRAAEACYDYGVAYEAPFISGKDSMFNDFKGFDVKGKPIAISVPPTLLVSSISVMENVEHSVTLDVKQSGHLVYLLGTTKNELGGSEYMAYIGETEKRHYTGKDVPKVDAPTNFALYKKYHNAVRQGLVASGTALDRGGLATALTKSAIGGQLGMCVDIKNVGSKKMGESERLFSESNGRFLVTVQPEKREAFEKTMQGSACECIGVVVDTDEVLIMNGKNPVATLTLKAVTTAYRSKFKHS